MNIKTFSDKTGLAYNTAHDLYTGRVSRIGLEVLDKVCRVLKMQPGDLLVWVDDAPVATHNL
ncbi:MAG: helix-turn-helix transcriptional regulator [Thiobacillus sp.]|nr:helix-turn-helix transcriptional regulator [Thiobacillus sp.]